jgi:hypothetical protein
MALKGPPMAADGTGIIENDLAYDVHDAFFESYDGGKAPAAIHAAIVAEFEGELLCDGDREVFVAALAECLWTIGQPVADLAGQLEALLAADAGAAYWGELYLERKKTLTRFLRKIRTAKRTPVKPKKTRLPKKLLFEQGDYLAFSKKNGKVVPVIVWYVEKRAPLRYDFVFPNLSKASDPDLIARLLDTGAPLTDDELSVVFTKGKRPKAVTIEHTAVKAQTSRFRKFGNRPFHFPTWQVGWSGYCIKFEDFEQYADEGGSRALTAEELRMIGC